MVGRIPLGAAAAAGTTAAAVSVGTNRDRALVEGGTETLVRPHPAAAAPTGLNPRRRSRNRAAFRNRNFTNFLFIHLCFLCGNLFVREYMSAIPIPVFVSVVKLLCLCSIPPPGMLPCDCYVPPRRVVHRTLIHSYKHSQNKIHEPCWR